MRLPVIGFILNGLENALPLPQSLRLCVTCVYSETTMIKKVFNENFYILMNKGFIMKNDMFYYN